MARKIVLLTGFSDLLGENVLVNLRITCYDDCHSLQEVSEQ